MSRLFRDVDGGSLYPRGSVVCIGAFDGLHLGHRALVRHAVARARALGLPAVALSFEPLPREFFARDTPPPRLTLPRDRVQALLGLGIDRLGLLRFNAALAAMPAEAFVRRVLAGRLGAREVWIGPEFRFGNRRGGDLALLQDMGQALGFAAGEIEPVHVHGERVSSTRIREALRAGDFDKAAALLGRPYAIGGRVVRGRQLGRTLGYPTANLRFPKTPALSGIYATWVHGAGPRPLPSVSSAFQSFLPSLPSPAFAAGWAGVAGVAGSVRWAWPSWDCDAGTAGVAGVAGIAGVAFCGSTRCMACISMPADACAGIWAGTRAAAVAFTPTPWLWANAAGDDSANAAASGNSRVVWLSLRMMSPLSCSAGDQNGSMPARRARRTCPTLARHAE